jgi:hypothetical protein
MSNTILTSELTANNFAKLLDDSSEIDGKTKQIIQLKLIEYTNKLQLLKDNKAFNNWSKFIYQQVYKYSIYYHNNTEFVPDILKKLWNKLNNYRKDKWTNDEYTDNYPYMLLLFDYSISDCDIIFRSYKNYMEETDFYLQFKLITIRLFLSNYMNNLYLLSYLIDRVIFYMQRRLLKICKKCTEIRHNIIKLFTIYKDNKDDNSNLYFMNILKKLLYYDKHGGLLSLNVTFDNKKHIKYIEKVEY